MIAKSILSFFLLSISYVNATNFTIALNSCKGDTDVVTLDSVTIDCDGSEYCTWGSVAQLTGAFTIQFGLDSSVAEVKAKGFGYKNLFSDDMEINICDYVDSSLNPDDVCPAAGTYGFSTEITLPEDPKEKWYSKFLYKTYGKKTVKFDFDDIADVKCKFDIYMDGSTKKEKKGKKKKKKKKSSDDEDYDDYMTSAAALLFVGAAAAFGVNRRRRVATNSGALLEGEVGSNFEMMGSKNNAVV
jgi:hypothetical protein